MKPATSRSVGCVVETAKMKPATSRSPGSPGNQGSPIPSPGSPPRAQPWDTITCPIQGTPPPTPVELNLDTLIHRLLSVCESGGRLTRTVSPQELSALCHLARNAFMSEGTLVEAQPPLIVCGDIHGQYADLLRIYNVNGFPPETNYVFLGDYVDRGNQSLETISLQFCLRLKYPDNIVLLRGNHETYAVNRVYGFYEECSRRYHSIRLWMAFQEAFNCMPLCARIGGRVLCMHGGLSPKLFCLKQLRQIRRPLDPVTPSLEIDLLWSDPGRWVTGWGPNTRGAAYTFGEDTVIRMCSILGLDLIVRAHQVVQDGYEFFAGRRLVTVFSAPNYCGQFDNAGAAMIMDENFRCSFQVYKPESKAVRLVLSRGEGGANLAQ